MDILDIIAAARTTSNNWVGQLTSGKTQAILTFATFSAAHEVAYLLEKAGAWVTMEESAYGETILTATWVN